MLVSMIRIFSLLEKNIHWLSKSTSGEQPVEDIPILTCICVYLFISRFLDKPKTKQTWNLAHTLPWTISKNPRKTAVSRGFFAYLLDSLVFSIIFKFKHMASARFLSTKDFEVLFKHIEALEVLFKHMKALIECHVLLKKWVPTNHDLLGNSLEFWNIFFTRILYLRWLATEVKFTQ